MINAPLRLPRLPPRSSLPGLLRLRSALAVTALVQLVLLLATLVDPARLLALVAEASGAAPTQTEATLLMVFQVLGLLATSVVLWRVVLVARYRPVPDVGDARLPRLTVVVPAYNEGRQVLSTLRSLALSRYPRERLQLIAVDDGSQDDTWLWIRRGAEELGAQLTTVRCARNGGKKHALAEGIRRATGEVVVTVDSDSEVLPDTLRLLVAPLVIDPSCGAVAGNVRVLNRHDGMLPRMLDACFTSSFDFGRAGESEVGGVMCCPGALSAWRTRMLRGVLDEWLAQTFFGQPAAIGEDRALTNLVLRSGATVRYQSTAIVLTQVPRTLRVLCKMLLRWARSNVRESLVLGSFIFRDRGPHGRARRGLQLLFVSTVLQLLVSSLLFVPSVVLLALHPVTLPLFFGLTLVATLPTAAIAFAVRDRRTALYALPWGLYSTILTTWIPLYALLTMHKSGWLTRGSPAVAQVAPVTPLRVPAAAPTLARAELPERLSA